jgi:phosphatidylserine/phosphatidylglycerophosphate/cardiolipin synthase-like enzyme
LAAALMLATGLGVLAGADASAGAKPLTAPAATRTRPPWTTAEFNEPSVLNDTSVSSQTWSLAYEAPVGALVQVAAFKLTEHLVARQLLHAASRGVHVQVILSGTSAASKCAGSPCPNSAFAMLSQLNQINHDDSLTWFRTCDGVGPDRPTPKPGAGPGCIGQELNHNKFALASASRYAERNVQDSVLVSSMNSTRASYRGGYNNGLQINNQPQLYAAYQRYFNFLALSTASPARSTAATFTAANGDYRITRTVAAHDLEMWAFPRAPSNDPVEQVLDRVRTAHDCRNTAAGSAGPTHTKVDVAMFDIGGRSPLLDRVAALQQRGCAVNIVYTNITKGAMRLLQNNGVALHRLCAPARDDQGGHMTVYVHSKYFLINGNARGLGNNRRTVYTGSENWTTRALANSDNQMLQYVEPAGHAPIFRAYQNNFQQLLSLSNQPRQHQQTCSAKD